MADKKTLFLGIDVGTSGTKALLVDETGTVVDQETVEYPLLMPEPLWAEQDPEAWWRAAVVILGRLARRRDLRKNLAAVGLTGQMHGSVFLDGRGAVIRPAILWCDQRTGRETDELTGLVGREKLVRITGNPAFTGFTAPKILWLRRREPDNFRRVRRVLLPKDYLRYRLTGGFASEVTDNSGTCLFDIGRRQWSAEIIGELGLDPRWFPPVFESPEPTGRVTDEAAALTGLPAGTPVAAGAGDQAASGVGNGVVAPGVVSSTIGTSGVIFAFSDRPRTDPAGRIHTMCHAVPGAWHLMGCTLSAGGALQWFRDRFCPEETQWARAAGLSPYQEMAEAAAGVPAGAGGLVFLPYLAGERTPHANPLARGAFFGITARHDKAAFTRAVMEGVVFALRDTVDIMDAMAVPAREFRVSGGGARSDLWCRIQAGIFGRPVTRTENPDTTALGAAILAACAAGVHPGVPEACRAMVRTGAVFAPDPAEAAAYERAGDIFRRLYPALAPFFDAAARVGV